MTAIAVGVLIFYRKSLVPVEAGAIEEPAAAPAATIVLHPDAGPLGPPPDPQPNAPIVVIVP